MIYLVRSCGCRVAKHPVAPAVVPRWLAAEERYGGATNFLNFSPAGTFESICPSLDRGFRFPRRLDAPGRNIRPFLPLSGRKKPSRQRNRDRGLPGFHLGFTRGHKISKGLQLAHGGSVRTLIELGRPFQFSKTIENRPGDPQFGGYQSPMGRIACDSYRKSADGTASEFDRSNRARPTLVFSCKI